MIGRRERSILVSNKLLTRGETERRQELLDSKLEDELVKLVEQRLKQGEVRGETIVLQDTCDLVGLTYQWMVKKYPRIKALFHAYQQNRSRRRRAPNLDEEEKVQQVQAAINVLVSQGEPVTLKRILHIVNLTYYQLRRSSRARALVRSHTEKRSGETF